MHSEKQSVVLIGMPGVGKSTLGVLLAKELGLEFVDTDLSIQTREGKTLQEIMDERGYLELRAVEAQVLLELNFDSAKVVATGGSAVYSPQGMEHLQASSHVVYLSLSLSALRERIHNYEQRGIARAPGQSFESLMEERVQLYRRYADTEIDCEQKTPQQCLQAILTALAKLGLPLKG
ncbi:shikimate kinase [Halioxenophilus sp. WMMB6]|uniref:shikimate kinase n=1 Tax=Halioxenophilus sp. WMMB6 TaxID=3073815 RepID=UPI00295F3559|nr:shikimate kinase [Halioxenophilus sp. WMMB6]